MGFMEEPIVSSFDSCDSERLEDLKNNFKEGQISELCYEQLNSFHTDASGDANTYKQLEQGLMQFGCSHYRRRCRIRAPYCNEIFYCRHCHNEAKNNIDIEGKSRHDLPRHQIQQVICSLCGTEQEAGQICINCGVCMAAYFCKTCKLYDDDTSKKQYHCNGCGICRIGGREKFFHCYKCGCCYSILLKDSHPFIEGAMHHDCPVCFEYLFESRYDVSVLPCGHTIHVSCLKEMQEHLQYACPLCSKSVCDMSKVWENLTWKLLLHRCLNHITIKWCGFCATTVEQLHKFSIMWWLRSVSISNPTILGKQLEVAVKLHNLPQAETCYQDTTTVLQEVMDRFA